MKLTTKVLEKNGKIKSLSKMFHDYSITKEQVSFYVVGMESWFEFLENKKAVFKFTDEENKVNLFLKGTVRLNVVCDAVDGMSGLYIIEVTEWEQLNKTDN